MQENPHPNPNTGDSNGDEKQSQITGISIAIIVFLLGGFFLWLGIHSYIPDRTESNKLFVESMFSLALVIVVIIQAGIYFRQAKALDAQLELSRNAVKYSEAAYVTVDVAEMLKKLTVGKPILSLVRFVNSGNTPAYDLCIYGHISFEKDGFYFTDQKAMDVGGETPSKSILGGHGNTVSQYVSTGVVDKENFEAVIRNKLKAHVWGIVLYRDIFKRNRWTRFCLIQNNLGDSLFDTSPTCNDADDEE